jgi:hypothetical protein
VPAEASTSPLEGDGQPPSGSVKTHQHRAPLKMTAATLPQQTAVTDGTGPEPALIPGLELHRHVPAGQSAPPGPHREDFRGAGIGVCGGSPPWSAVSRQS